MLHSHIQSQAEWDDAKIILMHTPRHELFMGILHPLAALYEKTFSPSLASQEHKNYINLLRKEGIQVHTLHDIILEGTLDSQGQIIQGKALEELREFAGKQLKFDYRFIKDEKIIEEQEKYRQSIISKLYPKELLKIILE